MYMSTTNETMVLVTLVAIDTFRKICGILQSKETAFFPSLIYTTLYMYTEISVYLCIHTYILTQIQPPAPFSSYFPQLCYLGSSDEKLF